MILVLFTLLPLLLGAALEYTVCRLTMRETGRGWRLLRLLRLLPPLGLLGIAWAIGAGRWRLWQSQQVSPLTQIILFPGVPALFALLGMALGNSAAAANFVLTGIAAEEAVQLPPDQARRKMASSYFSRVLMLALVLAAGLIISWFDPISVVFPLFFVKISLTVGYIFLGKGGNKN